MVLRAIYAADAAITIGTRISAPIADVVLFIAKNGVMLTCQNRSDALYVCDVVDVQC